MRKVLELTGILIKKRKAPQNMQRGKMSNLRPIRKELRTDTIDKSEKNALEDNNKTTLKTKNSKKKIKRYALISFSLKNFSLDSRNFQSSCRIYFRSAKEIISILFSLILIFKSGLTHFASSKAPLLSKNEGCNITSPTS